MSTFQTIILFSLLGNIIIGLTVLGLNSKRKLNRYFFLSTLLITMWLLCMYAVTLQLGGELLFWTRQVSAASVFLPLGFYILRRVIMDPDLTPTQLWFRLRYHLLAALSVALLCQTPFFARATALTGPDNSIPVSDYGPGIYIFIAYFVIMVIGMFVSSRKTLLACTGVQRIEGQFLLLGWMLSFVAGVTLFAVPVLINFQELTQFLPLVIIILDSFVAYGIATKRILSVTEVLQRVTAYLLVALLLSAEYLVAIRVGTVLFSAVIQEADAVVRLFAMLLVAFTVVPAQGWMHVLSRRIIFYDWLSGESLLARAGILIREISVEASLMENFAKLICEAFGAPRAVLLKLQPDGSFSQVYPEGASRDATTLRSGESLLTLLCLEREPITTVMLQRMRPTLLTLGSLETLRLNGFDLAVGGFMRGNLKAILLLDSKKSDRIYDLRDQRTLQILCDQFAVALENSNLYTEIQIAKIYNDILLDALTSGIVAVNTDCTVTVFNQSAQQITGLPETQVINQSIDALPEPISECLRQILDSRTGFRDRDISIRSDREEVPIRISGEVFHSHTRQLLGALVIFTDLTELKQMEAQIRRSDRLSSLGTLSAGMAHEIKNPLVTIKTFTQLLPEQFQDEAFRKTFVDLVGQEVKRIDTIVSRLLNFALPASATLRQQSLHEVVEGSLRLIAPQFAQNGIKLEQHLDAAEDIINADANQLNQAFVNFLLNSVHAMPEGGILTVRTTLITYPPETPQVGGICNGDYIQLDIEDIGCGIPPENLERIFDPFFTTKAYGVGLGLSVSHGIIHEHQGMVQVESRPDSGTVFHIRFPLQTAAPREQTL